MKVTGLAFAIAMALAAPTTVAYAADPGTMGNPAHDPAVASDYGWLGPNARTRSWEQGTAQQTAQLEREGFTQFAP
ncbi:MAG: hypothetical protein IT515_03000 [Burkholderiales bacterium]|nr:hypothetical protein [Burkholderiales bacterium]